MTGEEVCNHPNRSRAPLPVPMQAILPQYPEMILAAIEALDEENGSNKSSISKHIEVTHRNLPPAHSTLLTHHLNRMTATGQLVFLKNNYLKPDANIPPRRGRGRPPKPKAPVPPDNIPTSPRPRGRPPKSIDPSSPKPPPKPKTTTAVAAMSGRKRGRPPKVQKSAEADLNVPAADIAPAVTPPPAGGAPRGRGRPPKVRPVETASVGA